MTMPIKPLVPTGGRFESLDLTPNIDRIADGGMVFDKAYVGNSICAPSRATLLTGKHSHLNGKIDNRVPFNHDQPQFQKILQKNGYQTAMIGKIHRAVYDDENNAWYDDKTGNALFGVTHWTDLTLPSEEDLTPINLEKAATRALTSA